MAYDCLIGREFLRDLNADGFILKDVNTGFRFDLLRGVDQPVNANSEFDNTLTKTTNDVNEHNWIDLNGVLPIEYSPVNDAEFKFGPYFNDYEKNHNVQLVFSTLMSDFSSRPKKSEPSVCHQMTINLANNKTFHHSPRRMSIKDQEVVGDMIQDMLDKNVILPSSSEYASRIVLVDKINGQKRLCVDES